MLVSERENLTKIRSEVLISIQNCADRAVLLTLRSEVLGKKSALTEILKKLGSLDPDSRKELGALVNQVRDEITQAMESRESLLKKNELQVRLQKESVDVTLPGIPQPKGSLHPVLQTMQEMECIFQKLGFDICEGPEIETDFYNFAALNIPENHPARDMQDTFYFSDGKLLRTHTSPVQVHVMESQKPPIAMVAPGVVYRCDSDQTHTPMFHQLEALLVDRHVHFGHLKAVIREFLTALFGSQVQMKYRPSFFPFTEPSAEVDMSCVFCAQKGCRVCKGTGWIEIMGCGMVDPEVFRQCKIDEKVYTGFAFGIGIERVTMLRHGVNDLRLFFENDVRFLKQF